MTGLMILALGVLAGQTVVEEKAAKPDATSGFQGDPAWKELGKGIWFDPGQRRLVLRARVCLREGYLEHLLCLSRSKEHESILATEAAPRMIHAGLLLTGAEAGKPVQFLPEFRAPTGTAIDIEVEWKDQEGKEQRADARTWVKESDSAATMKQRFVFAGSELFKDPETGEMRFAADGGDLITVSNFISAILDVPIASSAADSERSFMANTAKIPALNTPVTMYLKPVAEAAAK